MRRIVAVGLAVSLALLSKKSAVAYEEVDVSDGGTIVGQIKVVGERPTLPPQPVFKNTDTCGKTVSDERLVVRPDGGIQGVVVNLEGVTKGKRIARDQPVQLDNKKCAFVPHVLSASVGQQLEIHNSDPFVHDAHALLGGRDTLFNVGLPSGKTVRKPMAYPGLILINCDVRHTWMHAYLFVADHPYHAVTDASGAFRIADVPPGTYTLKLWEELLGTKEQSVTVKPGETTTVQIDLSSQPAEEAKQ
jgi:plastocyanin